MAKAKLVNCSSLECSICFDDYDSEKNIPMLLDCGHTFCNSCIFELRELKCPTCRYQTKESKRKSLCKNFALLEFVEAQEQEKAPGKNHIWLNVGGKNFVSTRQTLSQSPTLKMLLKRTNFKCDKDDPLLLDRSGHVFKHVLALLSDGRYNFPREFQYELDFYQLNPQFSESPNYIHRFSTNCDRSRNTNEKKFDFSWTSKTIPTVITVEFSPSLYVGGVNVDIRDLHLVLGESIFEFKLETLCISYDGKLFELEYIPKSGFIVGMEGFYRKKVKGHFAQNVQIRVKGSIGLRDVYRHVYEMEISNPRHFSNLGWVQNRGKGKVFVKLENNLDVSSSEMYIGLSY